MTEGSKPVNEMLKVAKEVSKLLPLTESSSGDVYYDCPLCEGEGTMAAEFVKNLDLGAAGIQIFGVGPDLTTLESFIKMALANFAAILEENQRLQDRCAELQMQAWKWMERHDKLASGKYNMTDIPFPSPVDLPEAMKENQRLAKELEESQNAHEAEGLAWCVVNEAAESRLEKMREALRAIVHKCRQRGWLVAQDESCRELVKAGEAALAE